MNRTKQILGILLTAACLSGCLSGAKEIKNGTADVPEETVPGRTPELVLLSADETPVVPAPTVTPTPEPTQTPDPYAADVSKTEYREGFWYVPLNAALRERITGMSYPSEGCDVSYDELRYLRVRYVDFNGTEQEGELIVHRELAEEVLRIFAELFDAAYPLTSVRLVDDFGEPGDDTKSMEADNTSSFCYRKVTGSEKLSRHSYGAAIDINPRRNPYIRPDGSVSPSNGKEFADRSRDFEGKIDTDDLCYRTFMKYGWSWGGDFKDSKDYQHFSKEVER